VLRPARDRADSRGFGTVIGDDGMKFDEARLEQSRREAEDRIRNFNTLTLAVIRSHLLIEQTVDNFLAAAPDVRSDFEPVALHQIFYSILAAKNALPANNLKELIAWLKANPDKASLGTAGVALSIGRASVYRALDNG
jgi:hypothetical protein